VQLAQYVRDGEEIAVLVYEETVAVKEEVSAAGRCGLIYGIYDWTDGGRERCVVDGLFGCGARDRWQREPGNRHQPDYTELMI
jgi:hypothetical protein